MRSSFIIFTLFVFVSCKLQEKQVVPKNLQSNHLEQKDTKTLDDKIMPIFKAEDFSIEGFNYTHYELYKILSLSVRSHHFDNIIEKEVAKKLEKDLDLYIKSLQKIRFNSFSDWKKINRKSFLVNAYNAFILKKMITLNFKNLTDEILDEEDGMYLFKIGYSFNSFRDKEIIAKYPTADMVLSLYCFSKGCPEFSNIVYNYKNSDKEFKISFQRYLTHSTKVIFDFKNSTLSLPAYIARYRRFFPKSNDGWAHFFKEVFASDSKQIKMLQSEHLKVIFASYP